MTMTMTMLLPLPRPFTTCEEIKESNVGLSSPCALQMDVEGSIKYRFKAHKLQARAWKNLILKAQIKGDATDGKWIDMRSPFGVFHNQGDVIANKYKVIGFLGQGAVATTYEAETNDREFVALKAMSLRNMKGWKELDLFGREAKVLKSLKHPGIPEYVDYFEVDTESDRRFYIVQKVAKGKSLAELVQGGWRVSEDEVKRIALEILEVLRYLGSLRPPVIHRDIKPENIILDEKSGKVKVVDFGAVQDAASVTLIGSTVVGTYGYMAPEQFQNRATLQTDLYGLGGTILYMVSGRSPSSFPQKRLKVDFNKLVTMSPELGYIVEKLLEPAPEDRFQSAAEVIDALKGNVSRSRTTTFTQQALRPAGTKVSLSRTPSELSIKIPPLGLTTETFGTGTFAVAWNSFLLFWTGSTITAGAPIIFTLFSLPFWFVGVRVAKSALSTLALTTELEFKNSEFVIKWKVGSIFAERRAGKTKDISSVSIVVEGEMNGRLVTSCKVAEGIQSHKFGSGLEVIEQNWLVEEISDFLGLPPPKLGKASRQTGLSGGWNNWNDFDF